MKHDWVVVQEENSALNLPPLHKKVLCEFFKEFPRSQERIRAYAVRVTDKGRKSAFYLPLYDIRVPAYKVFRFSIAKDSEQGVTDVKEAA